MDKETNNDLPIHYTVGNAMISALTTSLGVVLVQSPFRRITHEYLKTKQMPTVNSFFDAGLKGAVQRLYHGFNANMTTSSVRSMYFVTSKKGQQAHEEVIDRADAISPHGDQDAVSSPSSSSKTLSQLGQVTALSSGDLLLTHALDTKANLIGLGKLDKGFKIWKNPKTYLPLLKSGLFAKFTGNFVNFASLCVVEGKIAEHLPLQNESTKHFVAGAMSGAVAAACSYPFSAYRDRVLLHTKVNGLNIQNPSFRDMLKMGAQFYHAQGPKDFARAILNDFMHQLPIKALSTALIFSTIAGINSIVGLDPINKIEDSIKGMGKKY